MRIIEGPCGWQWMTMFSWSFPGANVHGPFARPSEYLRACHPARAEIRIYSVEVFGALGERFTQVRNFRLFRAFRGCASSRVAPAPCFVADTPGRYPIHRLDQGL